MAYIKEDLDRFFEFSYLPSKRLIWVGSHDPESDTEGGESGTNCTMAEFFIKAITHLNTISHKPIVVHMNNPGGDYLHGMAMYDAIRLSPSHVYGIAWGYATSMGSIILQACDSRIIAPHCLMMIHDGTDNLSGPCKTVENWAKQSKKWRQLMYNIYYERMKSAKPRITLKKIEELCSHDTIFTAEESVNNGLADWTLESLDDPDKYYATDGQNAKWQSGMKLGKHQTEEEEGE